MYHQLIAMHQHLKSASSSQARWSANDRNRAIFQGFYRLLKPVQKGIHFGKIACVNQCLKMIEIHPGGKMLGIIMDNNGAPVICGSSVNNLHRGII